MAERLIIVTHTDLDGVASAAIYLRLAGRRPRETGVTIHFTEPYKLNRVLSRLGGGGGRLAIMDLGPNRDTIGEAAAMVRRLVGKGYAVEWYDHHRWDEDWVFKLTDAGARVFIDTSTCAAGVVARYASEVYGVEPDSFVKELAAAVCAADLWRWDHPMAARLFRVAERYRGRRGDAWRRRMVEGFAAGSMWWPELEEALSEYLSREFEGFHYALRNTVIDGDSGCRFAVVLKKPGPPSPSILGNALIDRLGVDFVVLVRTRGQGMSFRSRRIDVRSIAYELGGGGHPRAAGARLPMPFYARLLSRIVPRVRLAYARRAVKEALRRVGCRRLEGGGARPGW